MLTSENKSGEKVGQAEGYAFKELSKSTWPDFEKLFAKHDGVWGGCWCMFYHQQGSFPLGGQVHANQNMRKKQALVSQRRSHGIIVYSDETPVGWCQFGTRQELPRLDASRSYQKEGAYEGKRNLWRVTCFFVDREFRGKGVAKFALKAAIASIRKRGGGVVEAYPFDTFQDLPRKTAKGKASFLWSGTVPMFREAGFKVIAPLGKSRRLVRRTVFPTQQS